jgi:hypothetical protein
VVTAVAGSVPKHPAYDVSRDPGGNTFLSLTNIGSCYAVERGRIFSCLDHLSLSLMSAWGV